MVVNFRTYEISRGKYKLVQTFTLINKKKILVCFRIEQLLQLHFEKIDLINKATS